MTPFGMQAGSNPLTGVHSAHVLGRTECQVDGTGQSVSETVLRERGTDWPGAFCSLGHPVPLFSTPLAEHRTAWKQLARLTPALPSQGLHVGGTSPPRGLKGGRRLAASRRYSTRTDPPALARAQGPSGQRRTNGSVSPRQNQPPPPTSLQTGIGGGRRCPVYMDEKQAKALRKSFPDEEISTFPPSAGSLAGLDYVNHAAVTDRLIEVDPDWTWEPLALDERGLPALDEVGNLWIKLTVCGVTRLGVGDKGKGSGDEMKKRVSDALKNAAMRFGVALDLWAKEDLHGGSDLGAGTAKKAAPAKPRKPVEVEKTSVGGNGGAAELPEPPPHPLVKEIEAEYGGPMTDNQRKAIDAHQWDEKWLANALEAVKKSKEPESAFVIPKGA